MNKELKNAILNKILFDIDKGNNGMLSSAFISFSDLSMIKKNNITFRNNSILQDGEIIGTIKRKYAQKKVNGNYKELKPAIEYI